MIDPLADMQCDGSLRLVCVDNDDDEHTYISSWSRGGKIMPAHRMRAIEACELP